MRTWQFVEPGADGPVYATVNEEWIKSEYFPYWSDAMRRVGKADLISLEHCIDDFVAVHWATEVLDAAQ